VDRRSDNGVGYVRAETLDLEGVVQECVARILRVVGDVEDRIHAQYVRQHEEVQMQRVVPDHQPVIRQPPQRLRLLRDLDPLRAFDCHQGSEEMGDRACPADPGQKGRNRDHSLASDRRREEPPVVPDHESQVLDRVVLDDDLQTRATLDLRDDVYCYVSATHVERR
jgi:hypothetical protein